MADKTMVDYTQKIKPYLEGIAPIEPTTTASSPHAVGDTFYVNGTKVKCIVPISVGDTIAIGTNVEEADDTESEIRALTNQANDMVNMLGSKNLNGTTYQTKTGSGLTWTVNSDGSISLSGASAGEITNGGDNSFVAPITAQVILSGGISDDAHIFPWDVTDNARPYSDSGKTTRATGNVGATNELSFYMEKGHLYRMTLRCNQGATVNGTFYPMLRLASITDNTYVQYAKTNQELTAENQTLTNKLNNEIVTRSTLGAKNILPFDFADIKALNTNGTWAGNVYTYRGVAFTVNSDGTISATGTATGGNASIKIFAASSNYEMLGKEVILNGCPSGGGASTYRIQAYRMATADGSAGTYFDDGAGTDAFTALNDASGTVGSFAVAVYENETVTNLLFKPMVRLASDLDDTYQPYAKTNRELTAENQILTQKIGTVTNKTLAANATSIEFDVPTSGNNLIKFYSSDGSPYITIDTSVSGKAT